MCKSGVNGLQPLEVGWSHLQADNWKIFGQYEPKKGFIPDFSQPKTAHHLHPQAEQIPLMPNEKAPSKGISYMVNVGWKWQ